MNTPQPLLPRVAQVQALDDFLLRIEFKDGAVKRFDVKPYLNYPAFQRLKTNNLFFKVHVEHGTVVWDDRLDLSPDTLYSQGVAETV
jgi:Protein of unknown function (DUF2442)